jgi:hypothetical protein
MCSPHFVQFIVSSSSQIAILSRTAGLVAETPQRFQNNPLCPTCGVGGFVFRFRRGNLCKGIEWESFGLSRKI